MSIEHSSQKNVLHPQLSKIINSSKCKKLLDYGCGDGRLLKLIRKNIKISIFDSSPQMLEIAQKNLKSRISEVYYKVEEIPKHSFDCVLISMVLMTIKKQKDVNRVLSKARESLKHSGFALIAVSHPCFRQYRFSSFSTNVNKNKKFNYFKEGFPFLVDIHDNPQRKIVFEDYHWSVSNTINMIIKSGFIIDEVIETKDDIKSENYNSKYSPFLIIKCKV